MRPQSRMLRHRKYSTYVILFITCVFPSISDCHYAQRFDDGGNHGRDIIRSLRQLYSPGL